MRFVKPLDVELVKRLAKDHDYLVTVEEGCTMGGAGSAVAEGAGGEGIVKPLLILGLPDKFIDQGDPGVLLASVGLDAKGIGKSIRERFGIGEPRLVVNNALAAQHTGQQLSEDSAQQIAYAIDADIVQYLDLSDVGAAKNAPGGYGLSAVVSGYNPNWLDEERLGYGEPADAYRLASSGARWLS
jgi:hypothetical protein